MTDMTTTAPKTDGQAPASLAPADKPATPNLITLEQLASEMKVSPRDARMLLRLAAKQKSIYPNLGKDHVARQPWQWAPGSKALAEAKKALTAAA
jgi:hypothetical protein